MPPKVTVQKTPRDNRIHLIRETVTQRFNPKLRYYVNDFMRDMQNQYFETYEEFEKYVIPRIVSVAHRVTAKSFINFGKLSEKSPCALINVTADGFFGGGKNGIYYIKKPSKNPDKEDKWTGYGPFYYLNTTTPFTTSREAVNIPYHADLQFTSDKSQFNVFPGFEAEYQKDMSVEECIEVCKPVLDHIRKVWASDNNIHFHYIMEFIAYCIRELKRTNVMMVVKGEQGAGKGVLADFFQRFVFGINAAKQIQGLGEITGQFNCLLRGAMLVVIDELSGQRFDRKGGNKSTFDVLKRLITGDDFRLTHKGVDSELLANIISYILFTNHDDSIFLEEKDRRTFMIEASSIFLGNFKYFDELIEKIMNKRVGDAFYTLCRKHPKWACEGWDGDLRNIPETALKKETIKSCKAKSTLFLDDIFVNGTQEIQEDFITGRLIEFVEPEEEEEEEKKETKEEKKKREEEKENKQYFLIDKQVKKDEDPKRFECHALISISNLYSIYKTWHKHSNNGELWSENLLCRNLKKVEGIKEFGRFMEDGSRDTFIEILPILYKKVFIKPKSTLDYDKVPVVNLDNFIHDTLIIKKLKIITK
jgi:uncharacterized protein DUF5906